MNRKTIKIRIVICVMHRKVIYVRFTILLMFTKTALTYGRLSSVLISGGLNVFNTCLGTFLGGCIVSKKKLSPLACIKMLVVVSTVIAALGNVGLFLSCGDGKIVGISKDGYG